MQELNSMQELDSHLSKIAEIMEQSCNNVDKCFEIHSKIVAQMCKSYNFSPYKSKKITSPGSRNYYFLISKVGLELMQLDTWDHSKIEKKYDNIKYFHADVIDVFLPVLSSFILDFYAKVKQSLEKKELFVQKSKKFFLLEEILLEDSSPLIMQASVQVPELPASRETEDRQPNIQNSVQVPELPASLETQDSEPNIQNIEVNESSTTEEVNLVAELVQTVQSNLPVETNIIQVNNTGSTTGLDDGRGSDPEFWGEVGETWAERFYKWLGYGNVDKQSDGKGFDFLCQSDSEPNKICSEVKARSYNSHNIRLTLNEWSYLMNPDNHDAHEILLILHRGERDQEFQSVFKIVRISQVWATFTNNFSKLIQDKTSAKYTKELEPLIALQLNSSGNANDVILNWKRLIDYSIQSDNIKEYCPLSEFEFQKNPRIIQKKPRIILM